MTAWEDSEETIEEADIHLEDVILAEEGVLIGAETGVDVAATGPCTRQFAVIAAKSARFLSGQPGKSRSTAASVSRRETQEANRDLTPATELPSLRIWQSLMPSMQSLIES